MTFLQPVKDRPAAVGKIRVGNPSPPAQQPRTGNQKRTGNVGERTKARRRREREGEEVERGAGKELWISYPVWEARRMGFGLRS